MSSPHPPPGLAIRLQAERAGFIAEHVEAALQAAVDDGPALRFTENGMSEPTRYARRLEADAADAAEAVFNRILQGYLAEVARFTPHSPYNDEVEHAGNEYHGAVTKLEQAALERLSEAHAAFMQPSGPPMTMRDEIYALLKAPLEFADLGSASFLTPAEQAQFRTILRKLRRRAAG